jgi:hypothetical protein
MYPTRGIKICPQLKLIYKKLNQNNAKNDDDKSIKSNRDKNSNEDEDNKDKDDHEEENEGENNHEKISPRFQT